jgi:hypothetical protein
MGVSGSHRLVSVLLVLELCVYTTGLTGTVLRWRTQSTTQIDNRLVDGDNRVKT